jgi:DNA-binding GntR family transcriptional regulator
MPVRVSARRRAGAAMPAPSHAAAAERDTLRLRVYRSLARGLMAGAFEPGEAVTLRTLASRLGTSAMPVRDAVSRLIAERALVLLPNRSVIVPRMSRARFAELNETRKTLEGMAAEAACARAGPALLRELADINAEMKRCIAANDFRGALLHNMNFHFTLYRAADKEVIQALIEMLWLQAGPFLALSLTMPEVRWTARHHHAILTALRSGEPRSVRTAVEADIEESSRQLLAKAIFEDGPRSRLSETDRLLVPAV